MLTWQVRPAGHGRRPRGAAGAESFNSASSGASAAAADGGGGPRGLELVLSTSDDLCWRPPRLLVRAISNPRGIAVDPDSDKLYVVEQSAPPPPAAPAAPLFAAGLQRGAHRSRARC